MAADDGSIATHPNEIRVCCLACGTRYGKPISGTVTRANPGCPACGYLGWVLDTESEPATRIWREKKT
jgi:hypothetical protein